jgi:mannose-1-phosphate guanylyltransferase/phosphomannomutase
MFRLGGKPILESNLMLAREAGAELAVINLHYLAEVITDHFGDGTRYGIPIHWSYEAVLRGTGGALDQARGLLSGHRLLIIYADNLFVGPVEPIVRAHEESGALATIARLWREDVRRSGEIIFAEDNRVEAILEKQSGPAHAGWVNAGLIVAEPELLQHVPDSATSDLAGNVLPAALKAGAPLMSVPFPGHVWWIDTPQDLRRACEQFSCGYTT